MTTNREIVEQLWSVIESQDFDALGRLVDEDFHWVMPGMDLRGLPALRQLLTAYVTAMPDLAHRTVNSSEQGDTVAVEIEITGTHTGPFQTPQGTLPPTGNPVLLRACDVVRVRGGKVISWHAYYDPAPLMIALGAMPPG